MESFDNKEKNLVEDIIRYKKIKWGYIAKVYSKEEEEEIYREATTLIYNRYGHIRNYDSIFETLTNRGNIYTMDITRNRNKAFYDKITGNVGLPHFLNRITSSSMHEFVHKIGFEVADESFKNMNLVFNEAGTEIVGARSLSNQEGRNFIFKSVWAKFPEKVDDSFLNVCLTNQLNEALGGEYLERSILTGRDLFKKRIIEKYGEPRYVFLSENMKDLSREERRYWAIYQYLTEEQRTIREEKMKEKIFLIQDCILESEFEKRFENIDSLDNGKTFLNDLKEFGKNRVKIKKSDDTFEDPGFKDLFEKYKKQIETKYGKTDIFYDESEWEKCYEEIEDIQEVTDDEKRTILDMSIMFNKNHRSKSTLSRFLDSILKKQEVLPENFNNIKEDKTINFKHQINMDYNFNQDYNYNLSRLKGSLAPQNLNKKSVESIKDDMQK